MVPGLRGAGVPDGASGGAEGHHGDPLHGPPAALHRGPLQSVGSGDHADGQPEEVSAGAHTWSTAEQHHTCVCVWLHRLFFRRHYAVNTVIFCSLDPQGRK